MKRTLFTLLTVLVLAGLSGCATERCSHARNGRAGDPCARGAGCERQGCARDGRGGGGEAYNPGPPTGQVTYPYYTLRGPRDFLDRNPRSIGP